MIPAWTAKLTWPRMFTLSIGVLLIGRILARRVIPEWLSMHQVLALSSAILAIKLLLELCVGARRCALARRNGDTLAAQCLALLPIGLVGLFRLELAQHRGFVSWLRRQQPTTVRVEGDIFEHYGKSQYPTIFIIVMFSCATEVPINGLVLHVMIKDPVIRGYAHWLLGGAICYTVMWLIADRHLLRHTQHVISADALHLRVGARFSAEIPWDAIEDAFKITDIKEMTDSKTAWLRKNGFAPSTTVIGTPIDAPNVALVLGQSVPATIEKYKTRRHGVRHVLLYVDEPDRFVHAVSAARRAGLVLPAIA
jgi:hypothetical protein